MDRATAIQVGKRNSKMTTPDLTQSKFNVPSGEILKLLIISRKLLEKATKSQLQNFTASSIL